MESTLQRCARVVTALEDLAEQEATALAHHDFQAVVSLQERTQPLVEFVVAKGEIVSAEPALRGRVAAIRDRRNRTMASLSASLEQTRYDLEQTRAKQRRIARIMPAYGQPGDTPRHFEAVG